MASTTPEAGDAPEQPETAETGKRRLGWDAVLVTVAALWIIALAVVALRREGSRTQVETTSPVTFEVPPTTEPPTAEEIIGTIEIETGFTPGEVVACDTAGGRATGFYPSAERCPPEQRAAIGETVSYAILVENTGDHVLRNIQLGYRFLDDRREPVLEPAVAFNDGELDRQEASIPLLRPGERFGLGDVQYLERNDVAEVEVHVDDVGEWLPEDYYDHSAQAGLEAGELRTTGIEVGYGLVNEPVVRFTVESSDDQPVQTQYAFIVFRNVAGQVIGGTQGYVEDYRPVTVPPGGSVDAEVSVEDPMEIPAIDPTRTEIYLSGSFLLM